MRRRKKAPGAAGVAACAASDTAYHQVHFPGANQHFNSPVHHQHQPSSTTTSFHLHAGSATTSSSKHTHIRPLVDQDYFKQRMQLKGSDMRVFEIKGCFKSRLAYRNSQLAMVVVASVNLTACRSRSAGCDMRSGGLKAPQRRNESLKKKKKTQPSSINRCFSLERSRYS